MVRTMRTVQHYRRKAEECRAISKHISLREAREKLLAMAREWDAHAEEREIALRLATAGERSRTI